MSPGVVVALIVGVFFVIGIAVGVITVIALANMRNDRSELASRPADPSVLAEPEETADTYVTGASGVAGHWDGIVSAGPGSDRPSPDDTTTPGDRPHWPGDPEP